MMNFDSIWKDEDNFHNVTVGSNRTDEYEEGKMEIDSTEEESEEESETEAASFDSSIPENMLNYFLSTERGNRMKFLRSLSLRNKAKNSQLSDTRRNIKRKHSITPKRKHKKERVRGGGYQKTKRIIYLRP
jgi:hypothetical protein